MSTDFKMQMSDVMAFLLDKDELKKLKQTSLFLQKY
jgi:hypothetical protein